MAQNQTPKPASNRLIRDPTAGPVVYFDQAPTYGHLNGVIELTLTSRLLLPTTDGKVLTEIIAAGHLRGSVAAMASLRNAIDGALKMAAFVIFGAAAVALIVILRAGSRRAPATDDHFWSHW